MQAFHPSLRSRRCCEYTSHDCWLWQHSDSHNPSRRIGPSSFSPGQAGPSLQKTLIDLMDSCAVHTPSRKQTVRPAPLSAETKRQRPAKQQSAARLAKLVNFTAGPRGRFELAFMRRLPPPHSSTRPRSGSFKMAAGKDGLRNADVGAGVDLGRSGSK